MNKRIKSFFTLLIVFTLYNCIDPYYPNVKDYRPLLVVDGMITDANTSYRIKLTQTFNDYVGLPLPVTDATLYITDDSGNKSNLISLGNGEYKTDSTEITGTPGRSYELHIITSDGAEYKSASCFMRAVADIDSIYFARDQKLTNNGTVSRDGISIYVDSKNGDPDEYYRWDFDETWKFKIPYPKLYIYANCEIIYIVPEIKDVYCWKNNRSEELIFGSDLSGLSGQIIKKPITFIASDQSDRLLLEYSILVKQYSISREEHEFYKMLDKVNSIGGDIFQSQPYTVTGNIHNINDLNERVLGYFRVSAVKQKRKFISFNEIAPMHMPYYRSPCQRFEVKCTNPFLDDYCDEFNQIYFSYTRDNNCYFIEPIFANGGILDKLVFAKPECANCQLTGSIKKPDFWIDM